MQSILRPVDTVLNFGIRNMFTMLGLYPIHTGRARINLVQVPIYLCHTTRLFLLSQCQPIVHVQGPSWCINPNTVVAALFP